MTLRAFVTVLKIPITTLLAIFMFATAAGAQNDGAFDALSPGNQKIARALFEAQSKDSTETTLSADDIAAMKQSGKGWGQVFHEMKAEGLLQEKNLGQIVSRSGRPPLPEAAVGPTTGTAAGERTQGARAAGRPAPGNGSLITTASGRSFVAGAAASGGVPPNSVKTGAGSRPSPGKSGFGRHGKP